jgi:hypothetical protein
MSKYKFQVKIVAETRGQEHTDEIYTALKAHYKQVSTNSCV